MGITEYCITSWQDDQRIYDDNIKILCMDILMDILRGGNLLVSASTSLMLQHKWRIITMVLAWCILYPAVESYRWLYAWSDKRFQAKTLSLVNDILEKSGKMTTLPRNGQCNYQEGRGWKVVIECDWSVVSLSISKYNSTWYRCFGIKTTENGHIDIESGYCTLWEDEWAGRIIYYDKDWNKISTDVIPWRYYPTPLTAHQG